MARCIILVEPFVLPFMLELEPALFNLAASSELEDGLFRFLHVF